MQGFDGGCLFFSGFGFGGSGFFGSFLRFFICFGQLALDLGFGFEMFAVFVQPARSKQTVYNGRDTGKVIAEKFCPIGVFTQPRANRLPRLKCHKQQPRIGRSQFKVLCQHPRSSRSVAKTVTGGSGFERDAQLSGSGSGRQDGCFGCFNPDALGRKRCRYRTTRQADSRLISLDGNRARRKQRGKLRQNGEFFSNCADRPGNAAHRARQQRHQRQQLLADLDGNIDDFLLGFVDLRLAGGHGVCHFFLHRADDLSLVGDQTQSLFIFAERADQEGDVVAVFRAKELRERQGAALFVQAFELMQELGQRLLRIGGDVCRHLVGGRTDGRKRVLKTLALTLRRLQFLQQRIDGGRRHFGRFAQSDKCVGKRGGFVGGKSELLGRTTDTLHRGDNVFFSCGGIVAQNVDGIAELLDFVDWELEHVGNRRGGIARLFRAHPKGNRHLGRDGGKFRQLLNRDAKLSARCGKVRHFGGGNAQFGAHFLQLV